MKFRNKEGETKPQNTITVNEKGAGRGLMEDEREVPDGINPPTGHTGGLLPIKFGAELVS